MHMPTGMVNYATNICIGIYMRTELFLIEHLLIFDAVIRPELQPVFQFAHMRTGKSGNYVAFL